MRRVQIGHRCLYQHRRRRAVARRVAGFERKRRLGVPVRRTKRLRAQNLEDASRRAPSWPFQETTTRREDRPPAKFTEKTSITKTSTFRFRGVKDAPLQRGGREETGRGPTEHTFTVTARPRRIVMGVRVAGVIKDIVQTETGVGRPTGKSKTQTATKRD